MFPLRHFPPKVSNCVTGSMAFWRKIKPLSAIWLWTTCTSPLKPFTDSSPSWNLLPYAARCPAPPGGVPTGVFMGHSRCSWMMNPKSQRRKSNTSGASSHSLASAAVSEETDSNAGEKMGPHNPPPLRLLALGFTADRRDICSEWNL